jgi:hypothetical protein
MIPALADKLAKLINASLAGKFQAQLHGSEGRLVP